MSGNLPINWFDLLVLVILGVGFFVGKKRGMSEELLPLLQWLTIVVVSALAYRPLGALLAENTPLTLLLSYMLAYVFTAVLIKAIFSWVKKGVGEKLVGSDVFGRLEYYLGMLAGMVHFSCILLAALALLNARYISPDQLAQEARMQQDSFGSISFPTLGSLQQGVFVESVSGSAVKKHLEAQLIVPTAAGQKAPRGEPLNKRRERAVEEVLK